MKNNVLLTIYYLLLLMFFALHQSESEPSVILRIAFICALTFPTLIFKDISFPAVITLFYTLAIYGFSYSYMPYTLLLYVILTIVVAIFLKQEYKNRKTSTFLIIIAIYILIIDSINAVISINLSDVHIIEDTFLCFLTLYIFSLLSKNNISKTIPQYSLCFELIAIILSLFFMLNIDKFAASYGQDGLERSSWVDPNYFGMVIGMGTTCGLTNLFDNRQNRAMSIGRILDILVLVVSFPVLLLNASRGSILAVAAILIIQILSDNTRMRFKIFFVIVAMVGIYYLYTNSYFELLEYRMMADEGTGSGRTEIWSSKLNAFLQSNIFHWLFGVGFSKAWKISGEFVGFHNEYVGFFVEYGFVGLCMLLYILYYPIKVSNKLKNNRIKVFSIVVYLSVCLMTLEPFGLGILTFYSFYLYGFLLAFYKEPKEKYRLV